MDESLAPQSPTPAHEQPLESNSLGIDSRKLGIWTLIGSEVVFFSSLIVTFLVMNPRTVSGPRSYQVLDIPLTAFNTFVLICSSMTMVTALASIQRGDQRKMRMWLIATALLGYTFLGGQAYEFNKLFHEGVTLSSGLFGASFFSLTGFHGMHVFVGTIWIILLLIRAFQGGVTKENHMALEMVGLYWHFVDIVWIIIFTLVYLIQ